MQSVEQLINTNQSHLVHSTSVSANLPNASSYERSNKNQNQSKKKAQHHNKKSRSFNSALINTHTKKKARKPNPNKNILEFKEYKFEKPTASTPI